MESGVWFIGNLPLGKYYLVETQKPDGAANSNEGKVFILNVTDSGTEQKELGKVINNKYDSTILKTNDTTPERFTGDDAITNFKNWIKEHPGD